MDFFGKLRNTCPIPDFWENFNATARCIGKTCQSYAEGDICPAYAATSCTGLAAMSTSLGTYLINKT